MINEPLFQKNILEQIFNNFDRYLFVDNWILQYLAALFIIYLCYKLVTYKNTASYPNFLPTETFPVSFKQKNTLYGFVFLCVCFLIYAASLYLNETSLFLNYDTMSHNTMRIFLQGITPMWEWNGRLAPVAFADVNIIYAITHNFNMINVYVLLQTALICYLIFSFFSFIPAYKRLVAIALLILSPSFFWINAISYPEKMLFIYFWSSLIFFKKYALNPNKSSNLWWGILFTNFAIYTKESTILIYFGILIYSFLYNLWNEKIKLSSFIHPLKTMRQMPLEMLLFISMLIYAWFYLQHVYAILDSPYLGRRSTTIFYAAKLYIFEIIVVLCAVYYALKNLYKHNLCFLPAGLILGALSFMIMIVVYLRLNTFSSQLYSKTYYVVLAYMICLFYLLFSISDWKWWLATCCIICSITLFFDYNLAKREEGKSYREVAEFLVSQKAKPLNIFISEKSEPAPWWYNCWAAVYKYYWPEKNIMFYSSALNPKDQEAAVLLALWKYKYQGKIFHPIDYKKAPTIDDFYVIKKTEDFESDKRLIDDILHQKVFENKLFEVYKIK